MTMAGVDHRTVIKLAIEKLRSAGVDLDVLGEHLALVEAINEVPTFPPDPVDALRAEVMAGKVPEDTLAQRILDTANAKPHQETYNSVRTAVADAAAARLGETVREHAPQFHRQLAAMFDEAVTDLRAAIATLGSITEAGAALDAGDETADAFRTVRGASGRLHAFAQGVQTLPNVGYGEHGELWAWYVEISEDMTEPQHLPPPEPSPAPLGPWHAWLTAGYTLRLADAATKRKRAGHAKTVKDSAHNPSVPNVTAESAREYLGTANAVLW